MARLPFVDPETAPERVRDTFALLTHQLNIFKMAAHAETCFRPLLRLGNAILGSQQLDAKLREFAIMLAARLCSAEYEWVQHVPIAKATGMTEEQIAALERVELEAECFNEVEKATLRFIAEVVEQVKASDETFAELKRHLSDREVVELIITIGYYMLMARLTECTETDVDEPAGTAIVDQAAEESKRRL